MKTRFLVAMAMLPLLFIVLYLLPGWSVPVAVALLSALAVQELLSVSKFVKQPRIIAYAVAYTAFVPFVEYFDLEPWIEFGAAFVFVIALFAEGFLDHENVTFGVIGGTFLTATIFPVFLSSITHVMSFDYGAYIILFLFIPPFLTDVFALIGGRALGKTKLAPVISPRKTVEGAVCGLVASVLFCGVYALMLRFIFEFEVNYSVVILIGLLGSVAGQFGDLALSYVKREFKVKDFGSALPGHGGILDRFDSLFFAAPAVEIILTLAVVAWK
ncbi:phosphatidate cytidylyltransferase [Clostridia bacterium]|nr:phosphatidate cytidylyltransferase [Clostridia bacterium]